MLENISINISPCKTIYVEYSHDPVLLFGVILFAIFISIIYLFYDVKAKEKFVPYERFILSKLRSLFGAERKRKIL